MPALKVLVIDDHSVVRHGLRRMFEGLGVEKICEVENSRAAILALHDLKPDLIILDLNLEGIGGLELIRRILLEDRHARIIVFTAHSETAFARQAMIRGAKGYVSKAASIDELLKAVSKVTSGGHYIETDIALALVAEDSKTRNPLHNLNAREIEILRLLGHGQSLSQIATNLGVAYKTVANSCSEIKKQLNITSTPDLIRYSIEHLHTQLFNDD